MQAHFADEIEGFKTREQAEDALWRLTKAANARSGKKRQVTQADFDAAWARAESLEGRGEVSKASRMYETARELQKKIKSTKALGALDEMSNRRVKQDLVHLAAEQKAEKLQLKLSTTREVVPLIPTESPNSTWVLPRGWVEHRLPACAMVPNGRRYYYGLKSGRSVWHRPSPDDFTEDTLAPVKVHVSPVQFQGALGEVLLKEHKTPLVIDQQEDGPLVTALRSQKVSVRVT